MQTIAQLATNVLAGNMLALNEIESLVEQGARDPYELMYWAHKVREANFGNGVTFCSIAPGRLGGCSEDCKWCGQAGKSPLGMSHPKVAPKDDLLCAGEMAGQVGAECFCIVNSGRGPSEGDLAHVLDAAKALRSKTNPATHVSASLGEVTSDQARALKAAGIERYNHNLETSRRHFASMVTTHSYDDRLRTLQNLREAGIALCCGGIFGIGETWADRIELALTLREEVKPSVVPLNFLSPIAGTAMEKTPPLEPMECLRIIAMFRLVLPTTDLKVAGGRVNLRDMHSWAFYAGATSCISGNYLTTTGRATCDDLKLITDLGLTASSGHCH